MPGTTFRFKFSNELSSEIESFALIHRYDNNDTFKEAWEIWCKDKQNLINQETQRLDELKYTGNIHKKMYRSAKYYYKDKSYENKTPRERDPYIAISNDCKNKMDNHLLSHINNKDFTPAKGFTLFCNQYVVDILEYQEHNERYLTKEEFYKKLKKMYKNRYYILSH